jgi:hypothetical protein
MRDLESTLDALVADAPTGAADWEDVVTRAGRPRRRILIAVAAAALAGAVVLANPALGIGERLTSFFDGTPIAHETLPLRDLHVASAMVHGISPRVPGTDAGEHARLGATEIRHLATRNGRNYFLIENRHGERCFAVGPVEKRDYVFGQVGCPRFPAFPSPELPILDFSVWGGVGSSPHVRRLEGFAADGVVRVAVVLADGGLAAETAVESNVYSRTGDLPKDVVREIVALDADGTHLYSMCLVRGGCGK